MDVLDALRIAGRAGGIEPERDFVGHRVGGERRGIGGGEDILEQMHVAAGKAALSSSMAPTRITVFRCGSCSISGQIALRQWRCHDQRAGAAIGEHIGVLRDGEIGVERDRDAAGAYRAPERHRIIDGVVQEQRDAMLAARRRAREARGQSESLRACKSP